MAINSVKIIGSGLIGTSIGLALSNKNIPVLMVDSDSSAQALAQSLVDSDRSFDQKHTFDVVVLATPPSAFKSVLEREKEVNPSSTFVDILSIKSKPQLEVEALADISTRFVGTHPMAGREVSGPQSARGDLFVGRTWILCPSTSTSNQSRALALELIDLCGAQALEMDADEHDQAMALLSHAPQVIASLIAGQLREADRSWLNLVGQGFKDLTRIADSDAILWREILSENSSNVSQILKQLRLQIEVLERALADPNQAQILIENGNEGRSLIPGKHGSTSRRYIYLHVVIDDKAGQLAAIFNDCASANVNIEDVSIEHTPGQNTGLVTLSILDEKRAKILQEYLISKHWKVHSTSK